MLAAPQAHADGIDQVTVTATRIPEPIDQVPADVSVVTGHEIRARGATNMATALSLVPGVEAPPGGDAGPSSAVPSFWGLHEFDAFLLVVDGVPWGGAFNPGITTLDFNNVQRVEVLKGPAPVLYGATSFVGVVQVISYPAGEAANAADIAFGTYGSWRGSASFALPPGEQFRQSAGHRRADAGVCGRARAGRGRTCAIPQRAGSRRGDTAHRCRPDLRARPPAEPAAARRELPNGADADRRQFQSVRWAHRRGQVPPGRRLYTADFPRRVGDAGLIRLLERH